MGNLPFDQGWEGITIPYFLFSRIEPDSFHFYADSVSAIVIPKHMATELARWTVHSNTITVLG